MLTILFKAASRTLLTFGQNEVNGTLGFLAILHTWDQKLNAHFHLHCLVAGGAVSKDGSRWIPCKGDYLFNARALSLMFRGKFMALLERAYAKGELELESSDPQEFEHLRGVGFAYDCFGRIDRGGDS